MMKRNRLYTVKKGNMFSLGDQLNKLGSVWGADKLNGGVGSMVGSLGTAAGQIGGSLIGGGLQSGAGSAISNIGGTIGGALTAVNPLLGGIVSVGSGLLGGLTNRAFGSKMNNENIAKVESGIANTRDSANALSGASDSSSLLAAAGNIDMGSAFSNGYIGSDGWFSSKAKRKANELRKKQEAARTYAAHGLMTNANNVDTFLDDNVMGNFAAFGGILPQGDTWGTVDEPNTGAIEYGFMSDWLNNKRKKVEDKYKDNFFVSRPQGALFDFGGNLEVHGGDYPTGLVHISAGKSHEENPYDGVQMGVDPEGTPNLVEEGETIFNDYVFSNRIEVPKEAQKWLGVKGRNLTFAEASKQLEKEIKERPNDPVSRAGLRAQMEKLEEEQEFVKRCTSYSVGEVYDVDNNEMSLLNHNGYEYEKLG